MTVIAAGVGGTGVLLLESQPTLRIPAKDAHTTVKSELTWREASDLTDLSNQSIGFIHLSCRTASDVRSAQTRGVCRLAFCLSRTVELWYSSLQVTTHVRT